MFAVGPYSRPRLSFWAPHSRSEWRCRDGAKRGEEGRADGWREVGRAVSFRETKGDSFQQTVRRGVVLF